MWYQIKPRSEAQKVCTLAPALALQPQNCDFLYLPRLSFRNFPTCILNQPCLHPLPPISLMVRKKDIWILETPDPLLCEVKKKGGGMRNSTKGLWLSPLFMAITSTSPIVGSWGCVEEDAKSIYISIPVAESSLISPYPQNRPFDSSWFNNEQRSGFRMKKLKHRQRKQNSKEWYLYANRIPQ